MLAWLVGLCSADVLNLFTILTFLLVPLLAAVLFLGGHLHRQWALDLHAAPESTACRWCGYDLRASPHLCPECGNPSHVRPPTP